MENKTKHIFAAFIFLLPIWYISDLRFPDIIILSILTIWCDLDIIIDNILRIKGKEIIGFDHRNWLMHSIIFPIVWILWGSVVPLEFLMGFLYTVSIHLLCDLPWKYWFRFIIDPIYKIRFDNTIKPIVKPRGTYCCFKTYKRSMLWYLINTIVGLAISILFFIGVY